MVCFTCQKCNECLKKNAVVKHGYISRKCLPFWLTCIDCLKDFRNNEHVQHTSCVTEDVRYGGKGAQAKPQGTKQNHWLNCVEKVINTKHSNKEVASFLKMIKGQSNIPRARNKFHNFLKNKYRNCDVKVADSVFTMIENEFAQYKMTVKTKPEEVNDSSVSVKGENGHGKENVDEYSNSGENGNETNKKKSKKRKMKEEQMHVDNQESYDREINNKKRKLEDSCEDLANDNGANDGLCNETEKMCNETEKMDKKERKKRKKELKYLAELKEIENYSKVDAEQKDNEKPAKKSKKQPIEEKLVTQEELCEISTEEPVPKTPKATNFNWEEAITEVLRNRNDISLKRLKKIIFNEYIQHFGEPHDTVKLAKKFDKKLRQINNVVISGDKVMFEEQKS